MIIVSYMTPEPDYNKIKDLVFQKSSKGETTNYFSQDAILTYILILSVFLIWFIFS